MSLTSYRAAPPRVNSPIASLGASPGVIFGPVLGAGTYSRFGGDVKGARGEICRADGHIAQIVVASGFVNRAKPYL